MCIRDRLKGPDAMPMALIERLKEPIPRFEGMFSIFTDVAQTVASGEEAARFYEGVLGLSKVFDEELPDGLVDDIVGVPHGTHTVSYTHLDVYKRQFIDTVGALIFAVPAFLLFYRKRFLTKKKKQLREA